MRSRNWLWWGDVIGGALMIPLACVGYVLGNLWHGFKAGWIASRTMLLQRCRKWERN